jgi:hypothetical protein
MIAVALVQGLYFLAIGLWPLVHSQSFQKVTGPKTDLWLTKTVGVLMMVIGAGLIAAGIAEQVLPPVILIAMAAALGLLVLDLVYALRRIISPVYAVDALVEAGFLAWWIIRLIGG